VVGDVARLDIPGGVARTSTSSGLGSRDAPPSIEDA